MRYGKLIMSKIGKKPIIIPEGIEAQIGDEMIKIKGKNGELSLKILPQVKVELKDEKIIFSAANKSKKSWANWGTMRALVNNAVLGAKDGFSKILEIEGVGYRASMDGNNLSLALGFTNPIKISPPDGITISVDKNTVKISGADKFLVGQIAAKIRELKKPEPYKGKGIRYQGEIVRRKEGKKAASATT